MDFLLILLFILVSHSYLGLLTTTTTTTTKKTNNLRNRFFFYIFSITNVVIYASILTSTN